jgi:prepilin-type processing-associated H-X9-DG protein
MSNLHQIWRALKMYCSPAEDERLPLTLHELTTNYVNNPDILVCPCSGHNPGMISNCDNWTDYAYVSGLNEDDPNGVSAFCPPENHDGKGANVLYGDGSVQWLQVSHFVTLTSTPSLFFGTTNETVLAELQKRTKIIRGTKQIGKK